MQSLKQPTFRYAISATLFGVIGARADPYRTSDSNYHEIRLISNLSVPVPVLSRCAK